MSASYSGSYNSKKSSTKAVAEPQTDQTPADADRIPINGFQQVLEMLKIADPAFRESLLKRLAQRDRNLANTLRRDLQDYEL